jgi:hypothetical protein
MIQRCVLRQKEIIARRAIVVEPNKLEDAPIVNIIMKIEHSMRRQSATIAQNRK